eukprot:sb/3472328/
MYSNTRLLEFQNTPPKTPLPSYQQESTDTSKQTIRTRYLGHVTGYQPIKGSVLLVSVGSWLMLTLAEIKELIFIIIIEFKLNPLFNPLLDNNGQQEMLSASEVYTLKNCGSCNGCTQQNDCGLCSNCKAHHQFMILIILVTIPSPKTRNRPNQEILVPDWLITSHVT